MQQDEKTDLIRRAFALGLTPARLIKRQRRGRKSRTRYIKPAPAGRTSGTAVKIAVRLADGQGEARHVTPPPAAMVEARERRNGQR